MSFGEHLHMSPMDDLDEAQYDEVGDGERRRSRAAHFDGEIPRKETAHRIALTVLFVLVASVLRPVLGVIVVFELLFTLITRRAPGERVRMLANQITTYYYKVLRYLTYNESQVPFPFSDFPEPLEPDAFRSEDRDSEVLDDGR